MKRIITTAMLLMSMLLVRGSHLNSDLKISLTNNTPFTMVFDQQSYYNPSTAMSINNIEPGRHFITIYKMKNHPYHYYNYPTVVYSGSIDIPATSVVTAMVRPHSISIVDILPKFITPVCTNPVPVYGMHPAAYDDLRNIIESKSFDSSRLKIAKQAIRENNMTSRQVAGILDLLTFESTKLELAKYAYGYVADPSNYHMLYNEFTFDSSVDELIDFMQRNS